MLYAAPLPAGPPEPIPWFVWALLLLSVATATWVAALAVRDGRRKQAAQPPAGAEPEPEPDPLHVIAAHALRMRAVRPAEPSPERPRRTTRGRDP